tara:strand:- start:699 stop:989 length:291 start_codon:yes stop_codon:yes gene_type:complete
MATKPNLTKSKRVTTATCKKIEKKSLTKGGRLIRLLQARSGHDIAALSAELSWQLHTTRAALSRLRKAGYDIEKLPPGKRGGARYRISGTPTGPVQ